VIFVRIFVALIFVVISVLIFVVIAVGCGESTASAKIGTKSRATKIETKIGTSWRVKFVTVGIRGWLPR
jgi:putative copper export protein